MMTVPGAAVKYRTQVSAPVPAERAWALLADLRAWPQWTPTVQAVVTEVDRPAQGAAVTVKQPGRSPAHYVIDEVQDGRRFRWGSNTGGVAQWADHTVSADGPDSCTVDLSFEMSGPVGGLLGRLGARRIRGFVDAEAAALRKALSD
jgi:uncharacterized protein YndB with AHSA1/START domain